MTITGSVSGCDGNRSTYPLTAVIQIEGFFSSASPLDNIAGASAALEHYAAAELKDPVVMAPDAGRIKAHNSVHAMPRPTDIGIATALLHYC